MAIDRRNFMRGLGAAGAAALLSQPEALQPPVAIVLSGGNVDPLLLLRIIRHGLAANGRYLSIAVRIPDRPGSLARLLTDVQSLRANVVDVEHLRVDASLAVDEVDIVVHVETQGHDHARDVLQSLTDRGYLIRG